MCVAPVTERWSGKVSLSDGSTSLKAYLTTKHPRNPHRVRVCLCLTAHHHMTSLGSAAQVDPGPNFFQTTLCFHATSLEMNEGVALLSDDWSIMICLTSAHLPTSDVWLPPHVIFVLKSEFVIREHLDNCFLWKNIIPSKLLLSKGCNQSNRCMRPAIKAKSKTTLNDRIKCD